MKTHFKTKYNIYKQPKTLIGILEIHTWKEGWQFKMAKAQHCHHRYSAEEIMNAVMASSDSEQLNTDSDKSDISEVESLQETFKTSSPDSPNLQEKDKSKK